MNEILRVEHLSKIYPDGEVNALVDVAFTVAAGEYVAIMGPSGSGKSTLLNIVGALDRQSSGEVFFKGQPLSCIKHLDQLRSQKIGFVFQSFYLLPTLTALENVQVPMFESKRGVYERLKRAAELLACVKMMHRAGHLPSRLSVGEKQRVAIARALANDPELLLADEPTGNLDSHTAQEILELFARLHSERGMTLIIVTHDKNVALRANRILSLSDGKLVGE